MCRGAYQLSSDLIIPNERYRDLNTRNEKQLFQDVNNMSMQRIVVRFRVYIAYRLDMTSLHVVGLGRCNTQQRVIHSLEVLFLNPPIQIAVSQVWDYQIALSLDNTHILAYKLLSVLYCSYLQNVWPIKIG